MREGSIGLSNSEMAEFRRCKRKWYLHSFRGLKKKAKDEPGSALSIGNLVHDALAAYYDLEHPVDPLGYAEAALELQISDHPSAEDGLRKEFELVRAMLSGYLEWLAESGEDSNLRILGSEQMVRVPLRRADGSELGVTLLSKLDAPVERVSDGHRLMLEHKTTGSLDAPQIGYRIDSQFLTEHLARFLHSIEQGMSAEEAYADCSGVLVNLIKKVKRTAAAKPPFYARVDVPHNIHELRNHWKHVVAVAADIAATEARLKSGEDHHSAAPPTAIPDRCKWECEFFKVCPMADDGSDFEGALNAMYEEHDPLERYDGAENF